jgi:hypothetical protein
MYRLIALVPHQNARAVFDGWRRRLFGAGWTAAFSFPAAAPVALVRAPVRGSVLKMMADALRRQTCADGRDGTISALSIARVPLGGSIVCGPRLSVPPPPIPADVDLIESFPALVLGAGLLPQGHSDDGIPEAALPDLRGTLKFRAAALANMTLEVLPGRSAAWTIGQPHWLKAPLSMSNEQ